MATFEEIAARATGNGTKMILVSFAYSCWTQTNLANFVNFELACHNRTTIKVLIET